MTMQDTPRTGYSSHTDAMVSGGRLDASLPAPSGRGEPACPPRHCSRMCDRVRTKHANEQQPTTEAGMGAHGRRRALNRHWHVGGVGRPGSCSGWGGNGSEVQNSITLWHYDRRNARTYAVAAAIHRHAITKAACAFPSAGTNQWRRARRGLTLLPAPE
jgi:hypothetical protein